MAKTTARSRGWGTRAGNPLSEADGPPRRTVRPAGTSGPASGPTCTRLPSPPPTRRPLPKEGSHRQPKDTAASRGPAPERAPPGCGRRRKREGGRRGIGSATRAAAARARPNLAGACGSKTLPDGAAGHVAGRRNGIEGRSAGVPREPREQPRCPDGADVRVLSQTTHAQKPRDGNRTPLQATPARTTSLSGSTRTGRRRRRRRRRPRRPRSPARGPSASVTRPHKRSRELSSLPHVDPSRPARGGTPPGRTRPSPLDDARPSPRVPHRATARGTGGGAAGGRRERRRGRLASGSGGPGGEDQKRTRGEGGRSGGRGTPRTGRGRRTTATDDDAHTRLDLGRRRARTGLCVGPCEQTPSRATPLSGRGGRRLIVKRRSDRRSPGRNPGPQVRSKCR